MKLHEIKKQSEIYVAKLTDNINMLNINDNNNITKLKFKRIITKDSTTHFAEWCIERQPTKERINCVNASPFDKIGDILVFSKNRKDDMFVAIVKRHNINLYVNVD